MKRLLDRLMDRCGYVTKERYLRAAAPKILMALDEIDDADVLYASRVHVDARQRGIPCS